jgi:hypothetical protein
VNKNILSKTAAFAAAAAMLLQSTAALAENQKVPEGFSDMIKTAVVEGKTSKLKEYLSWDARGTEENTQNVTARIDETDNWELYKENLGYMKEMCDMKATLLDGDEIKSNLLEKVKTFEPVTTVRYGGGSSNTVNMANELLPISERTSEPYVSSFIKTNEKSQVVATGIVEYMKIQFANNPDSSVMPCVSPFTHTVEDIETLAHFFYDPPESEWGKKRKEFFGTDKEINVYAWELGNEFDGFNDTTVNEKRISWYTEVARSFAEAIRRVKPDATIISCGWTAPWGNKYEVRSAWLKGTVSGLADVIDAVSFHPYYDGYSPEYMFGFTDQMKEIVDEIVKEQDIRDENGELKDIYIVSTEGARWADPEGPYKATITVNAACCDMQWINMIFQYPRMRGNMMIEWIGTGYLWALWEAHDNDIWQSPMAKMVQMYQSVLGDRIVKSEWSDNDLPEEEKKWISKPEIVVDPSAHFGFEVANGIHTFSVNAMGSGKNEIVVMLTNKSSDTKVEVDFDLKHNYTLVEEKYITAPNSHTYAYDKELSEMVQLVTNEKNEKNFSHYTVPANGMVALRLRTTDNLPLFGETLSAAEEEVTDVELGDDSFKDISNHWAKNEIELMRQAGYLNGTDNGMFNPEGKITRSEFYTALARVLKSEDKFGGSVFSDVTPDMWYAKNANVAYAEGIITSDKFEGGKNVDFAELVKTVERVSKNHNAAYAANDVDPYRYDTSGWDSEAAAAFDYAVKGGYMNKFFENGLFDINSELTRAEAAVVLYRLSANLK